MKRIAKNLLFLLFVILTSTFLAISSDLPYKPLLFWTIICWGIINTALIIWFYYLYFKKDIFSKQSTQQTTTAPYREKSQPTNSNWLAPLATALFISFILYKLPAYPTSYFAHNQFVQITTVQRVNCYDAAKRSPARTDIYFIDEKLKFEDDIIFYTNICKQNPELMKNIVNSEVDFFGRKWLFGTIYDGFKLIEHQTEPISLFDHKKNVELSLTIEIKPDYFNQHKPPISFAKY